jgi:hypothetical protein
MATDDIGLVGPDEIAYRLELTPGELKVTHSALKSFLDDFGHEERDVQRIIRDVLDKLPPPASVESIDLGLARRGARPGGAPAPPGPHGP